MHTAAHEFARKGLNKAKTSEIAEKAGISKGSIYDYFRDKDALFIATCEKALAESRGAIESVISPDKDFFEQIEDIFRRGMVFVHNHPDYAHMYLNLSACGMERFADSLSKKVEKKTSDFLKSLIKKGIEEGHFRPDIDINTAAFMINSLYIMFMVAMVSRHYQIRFKEYMNISRDEEISWFVEDKITHFMDLLRFALKRPDK